MQTKNTRQSLILEVDGTMNLQHLVDIGKYNVVHNNINDGSLYFQSKEKRTVKIEFFQFNNFDLWRIREAVKKENYRPIFIDELLTIGAKYPKLQLDFPIIALGNYLNENITQVVLGSKEGNEIIRVLENHSGIRSNYNSEIKNICRFPAIHKKYDSSF